MKFKDEFKIAHPETIGEKDHEFDRYNYTEWLESKFEQTKLKQFIYIIWDLDDKLFMLEGDVYTSKEKAEAFMSGWEQVNGGNYEIRRYALDED